MTTNNSCLRIGAHVDQADPVAEALTRGAQVVQFFLADPQSWKKPVARHDTAEVTAAAAEAGVDLFVHAPYTINVASPNNRIRIPSRNLLAAHVELAHTIGAKGILVHGGHVTAGTDVEVGLENWRKTFERMPCPLPVLIENTAGGAHAMARRFDTFARLWETVGGSTT